MLWSNYISLDIINFSINHIHARFQGENLGEGCFLTIFYGLPYTNRRAKSWNLLTQINQGINNHWCVIGDSNEITTQDEKLGGRLRPLRQMAKFWIALEVNGLLDLGWKKQKFTWSNRHADESFTKERFDRTVTNDL